MSKYDSIELKKAEQTKLKNGDSKMTEQQVHNFIASVIANTNEGLSNIEMAALQTAERTENVELMEEIADTFAKRVLKLGDAEYLLD